MTFEEFKFHVETFLREYEGGIFLHPTTQTRALKRVSEACDLSGAVTANDMDAIKLAIGNIMFGVVGIAITKRIDLDEPNLKLSGEQVYAARVTETANSHVSNACTSATTLERDELAVLLQNTANWISEVAMRSGVPIGKCYESAWKDG